MWICHPQSSTVMSSPRWWQPQFPPLPGDVQSACSLPPPAISEGGGPWGRKASFRSRKNPLRLGKCRPPWFRWREHLTPACIAAGGRGKTGENRTVPPHARAGAGVSFPGGWSFHYVGGAHLPASPHYTLPGRAALWRLLLARTVPRPALLPDARGPWRPVPSFTASCWGDQRAATRDIGGRASVLRQVLPGV